MKRFSYFITTVLFTLLLSIQALASSAAITFSDPSVTVGTDVNVTMKVSSGEASLARADVTLAYDANLLEFVSGTDASGGAGTVRINGGTFDVSILDVGDGVFEVQEPALPVV